MTEELSTVTVTAQMTEEQYAHFMAATKAHQRRLEQIAMSQAEAAKEAVHIMTTQQTETLHDRVMGSCVACTFSQPPQPLPIEDGQTEHDAMIDYWAGIAKAAKYAADAFIAARSGGGT